MTYLGNTPTTQNFISGTDYFNGTGSQTAFTLSRTVNSVNDIQVVVNNVVQQPNDAYTLSGTTLTMTSAPSAGTNNVYVRYLSTTTQAITPSQGTVSWNTLDSNIQQDLGVMYKNRIINGNMVIDQRNAGAAVVVNNGGPYTLDRWIVEDGCDAVLSVQQTTDVPSSAGFVNSLRVTATTADPSIGATQYAVITQLIEGFNTADLMWGTANAKTVTVSFWVKASVAGQYSCTLYNNAATRINPQAFTINSANTWEYKTITISGDTTGTWLTTNGRGIAFNIYMALGSTYLGSAGWNGSNIYGVTGQANALASTNNTFFLTGVQLEVGTQATAFSTAGGSYGAELALCQRYFESCFSIGTAPAQNAGAFSHQILAGDSDGGSLIASKAFWVIKRASPTITYYNPAAANANFGNGGAVSVVSIDSTGMYVFTTTTTGARTTVNWAANAEL